MKTENIINRCALIKWRFGKSSKWWEIDDEWKSHKIIFTLFVNNSSVKYFSQESPVTTAATSRREEHYTNVCFIHYCDDDGGDTKARKRFHPISATFVFVYVFLVYLPAFQFPLNEGKKTYYMLLSNIQWFFFFSFLQFICFPYALALEISLETAYTFHHYADIQWESFFLFVEIKDCYCCCFAPKKKKIFT